MADYTYADIARMFDHAALQPVLTDAEMDANCRMAREYGVASVCIKPYGVPLAARILAGSPVKVCTVIGFPHGGHVSAIKVAESGIKTKQDVDRLRASSFNAFLVGESLLRQNDRASAVRALTRTAAAGCPERAPSGNLARARRALNRCTVPTMLHRCLGAVPWCWRSFARTQHRGLGRVAGRGRLAASRGDPRSLPSPSASRGK